MALTPESIRKIATLARLRCTPEEEAAFARQLSRVVDYVGQLERFESGESAVSGPFRVSPVREAEDLPRPGRLELPREAFLANAPAVALGEFLVVPEIKGGSDDG
jgi:aspartyl-tRNA(Asn)/glutamyl-tRNA(Gln) amidotransferase subunit C